MQWLVGATLGLALGGCATTDIPAAKSVRVTANSDLAQGCNFLGRPDFAPRQTAE